MGHWALWLRNAAFSQIREADHICMKGPEKSCREEPDLILFPKDVTTNPSKLIPYRAWALWSIP